MKKCFEKYRTGCFVLLLVLFLMCFEQKNVLAAEHETGSYAFFDPSFSYNTSAKNCFGQTLTVISGGASYAKCYCTSYFKTDEKLSAVLEVDSAYEAFGFSEPCEMDSFTGEDNKVEFAAEKIPPYGASYVVRGSLRVDEGMEGVTITCKVGS